MSEAPVRIVFDGHEIDAAPTASLLQAWMGAGLPLTGTVGCLGQGVCGACRVLIHRAGSRDVSAALACETRVEAGMQVAVIDDFPQQRQHRYALEELQDGWRSLQRIPEIFPEAPQCRHCGGCDRVCPKGIEVQKAVNLAVEGRTFAASELFEHCVMCDLCTAACPEHIAPNHLGMFVRRMTAALALRPGDLIMRLHEIEQGRMTIDPDAPQP